MSNSSRLRDGFILELREQFVAMLIATNGATTKPVQDAFRAVPRHLFVDQYYTFGKPRRLVRVDPEHPTAVQMKTIYSDEALATHQRYGKGTSSTSQPSLVANMLVELGIAPGMQIMEIGAGTGWNAALMGSLAGPRGRVYSIDVQADVARRARRHLQRCGAQNVTIINADGVEGCKRHAPYDRIITTVACPDIFPEWISQLRDGGAILVTLQDIPGRGACLLSRLWKRSDHLSGEIISLPFFMTMMGRYGAAPISSIEVEKRLEQVIAGRKPRRESMPWRCWSQHGWWVTQSLMFFAYLEGMSIEPIGQRLAIRWGASDGVCIPTDEHLEVYGSDDGYRKLCEVIQKWLELGAPKRDAYRIEAWPKSVVKRAPKNGWLVQREHSQLMFRQKKSSN